MASCASPTSLNSSRSSASARPRIVVSIDLAASRQAFPWERLGLDVFGCLAFEPVGGLEFASQDLHEYMMLRTVCARPRSPSWR